MSVENPKTADLLIAALRAQVAEWKELSGLPMPLTFASLEGASQSAKMLYEAADDLETLLTERLPLSYEDEAREYNRRVAEMARKHPLPASPVVASPAPATTDEEEAK